MNGITLSLLKMEISIYYVMDVLVLHILEEQRNGWHRGYLEDTIVNRSLC